MPEQHFPEQSNGQSCLRRDKRLQAAKLIEDVIEERLEPRLAINRWPEAGATPDPSLDAAWQAIWHFEADEKRHKTELFYLDAQLELLRQMAGFLSQGKDLPAYFLQTYSEDHQVRFFYDLSPVVDSLQIFARLKCRVLTVWNDACQLALYWYAKTRKPPQH